MIPFVRARHRAHYLLAVAVAFTGFALTAPTFSQVPEEKPEQIFFGNLHSHTSYSDGVGTPREAYAYARDTAKLDFLALTEHNHLQAMGNDNIGIAKDHSLYTGPSPEALIPAAHEFSQNGRFIALYGQEFSSISKGNHVNVFDMDAVITAENGRFDQLLEFLQHHPDSGGQPPVLMFNHPYNKPGLDIKEYGRDDFGDDKQWLQKMGAQTCLLEIINGEGVRGRPPEPVEDAYLKFLNLGFKLAPVADQDNHAKTWGTATTARTGVIASSLTKTNLLSALRQRHVYATEDQNLKIIIKVNSHLCGDVTHPMPPAGKLKLEYAITDADEPDATYEIAVWRDAPGGPVAKSSSVLKVNKAGHGAAEIDFDGTPQYLFFKIEQISPAGPRDRCWTAPIWFEHKTS